MAPLWALLYIVEVGLVEAFGETLRPRDGAEPDVIPGWVSALVVVVRSGEELLKQWPRAISDNAHLLRALLEHVGATVTESLGMYRLNKRRQTPEIGDGIMEEYDEFMQALTSELEGMVSDVINWACEQDTEIVTKNIHVLAGCQMACRKCNALQKHRFTQQLERFCDVVRRHLQERSGTATRILVSANLEAGTGGVI
eukprot:symbB.v1.2.041834.t1/scaffold8706.1/size6420/1